MPARYGMSLGSRGSPLLHHPPSCLIGSWPSEVNRRARRSVVTPARCCRWRPGTLGGA